MKKYKSSISRFRIVSEPTTFPKAQIKSSRDAADFIKDLWEDDIEVSESFYALFLNRANNTSGYAKLSNGGINGTIVEPLFILKYAADLLSKSVILFHNHPSGSLSPSDADKKLTDKVNAMLKFADVTVIDHVILGLEDRYFSFADEGLI
ncbi:MAG: JAB domain-containing protein [Lentimicrobium sp.]|nr:JAB domain-containing protein [Lentimicrobium sp.]